MKKKFKRKKKFFFRRPKFDHDNDDDDDDDNNNKKTTIRARKAADRGVTTAHSGPSGGRTAAAARPGVRFSTNQKRRPDCTFSLRLWSQSLKIKSHFGGKPFLSDDTDLKKYAAPPPPTLPSCVDAPCRRRDLACSGRQPS
ncbi:hypothetical protein T07_6363 [Trichinella nelsoni]|uniref:Uncharacterized protein n=1 Tax=Trichinella nelsoni TaxID=6336 RepID=A0A0V0RG65_9BILA|nr:hypothetical protein T07_6363 [Trichinella nelsoni]